MEKKQYVLVTIACPAEDYERVVAESIDAEALGAEEKEDGVLVYFSAPLTAEGEAFATRWKGRVETIEERNWNADWEASFEPVRVGNFCGIRAHFHPPMQGVEYELLITPKMSFGTGHHATTAMMIAGMEGLDFRGRQVLDFGTGTGVLAILAGRLGAATVLATDNDPWSIANGEENRELNGVDGIQFLLSEVIPPGAYDIVLANINRNVLLAHMSGIVQNMRAGGQLLLSGILEADKTDLVTCAAVNGLDAVGEWSQSGWIALLFVKPV